MEQSKCKDCKFYKVITEFIPDKSHGEGLCRSHPPSLVMHPDITTWGWPKIGENDWCGEWSR
jgi:hypothetical protein